MWMSESPGKGYEQMDDDRKQSVEEYYAGIRARFERARQAPEEDRAFLKDRLVREFIEVCSFGIPSTIAVYLDEGMDINAQDPRTGMTALLTLAGVDGRPGIRFLVKQPGLDFLIRDAKGRLPCEMAYLHGDDPALARFLSIKERKQAEAQGIRLTRRPLPATGPHLRLV